jgi:hypothetical protein
MMNDVQIAGYTVYYLKGHTGEIKSSKVPVAFPLEIVSKFIRPELKESFLEFLDKINHRVPLESEFNEWYLKHNV